MVPHRLLIAAAMVSLGFLWASARAQEPTPARPLYNTFSDEEEMAVGRNAAAQTEKQLAILNDTLLESYIDHVGQKVSRASRRSQLEYHFRLVDTPSVNAFSLPGGYIYVNRGLLEFVESESELVGVLGHEVGHIVAYHGMNDLARRMLVDRVLQEAKKAGLMQDQQVQDMLERYGGPALLFVDRKFSRDEELEADLLGLYNAQRAGWDPEGIIAFLARLRKFTGNPDLLHVLLMNHPLPADRIERLRGELKQMASSSEATKDSLLFLGAKTRLKFLPPPPQPQRKQE